MARWLPRNAEPAEREVLVEGVPAWMRPALLEWLKPHLTRASRAMPGDFFFEQRPLQRYDLVARLTPSYIDRLDGSKWPGFVARLPDEELLDLVDWVIHDAEYVVRSDLEDLLELAGSVWMVGRRNGNHGLVRRMPESVQAASEQAMSEGSAGKLLGEAWAAAYGRRPDPEQAYEMAIKAVEEALVELVSPRHRTATLGSIIGAMRDQGWTVDLPGEEAGVVVAMAKALWTGQESRHGGNGYRKPSQSEAETAVTLAVALVHLAASGSIARRPKSADPA